MASCHVQLVLVRRFIIVELATLNNLRQMIFKAKPSVFCTLYYLSSKLEPLDLVWIVKLYIAHAMPNMIYWEVFQQKSLKGISGWITFLHQLRFRLKVPQSNILVVTRHAFCRRGKMVSLAPKFVLKVSQYLLPRRVFSDLVRGSSSLRSLQCSSSKQQIWNPLESYFHFS